MKPEPTSHQASATFVPSVHCATGAEHPVHRQQSSSRRWPGSGYLLLFIVVAGLLATGAWTVQAMITKIRQERQTATEAARPAAVSVAMIIPANCPSCYNVNTIVSALAQNTTAVKIEDTKILGQNEPAGADLVTKYSLQRLPVFIITGEVNRLLAKLPPLKNNGLVQDGAFVGVNLPPPYVQLSDGRIRGEFEALYVTEKQCQECYDPTINRQALAQLNMIPRQEKTVDRLDRDGQAVVKKYSLTTTPTIILTGDLAAYDGFDQIWKQNAGTIESDGAYVFRTAQERMGTYYDLTAKKIIAPPATATNTNSQP